VPSEGGKNRPRFTIHCGVRGQIGGWCDARGLLDRQKGSLNCNMTDTGLYTQISFRVICLLSGTMCLPAW
jgi:hypothetical protein